MWPCVRVGMWTSPATSPSRSPSRSGPLLVRLVAGPRHAQPLPARGRAGGGGAGQPVLILAGGGSGKTRVIPHRIAHLVLERGVPSERILAVTFTNKAAEQMRQRAEALLEGRPLRSGVPPSHSFCVRLLRREAAAAGIDPGFLIYDEDDQLGAVREALRELGLPEKLHPPRRLLARLRSAERRGGKGGKA